MLQLKIDPEFKDLIQPLSTEEFEQLEQNILQEGCRDAIKIWRGYIIDGHNRYTICQKHDLPYDVKQLRFASKSDAKVWIAENQLGRRNLTPAVRIEIAAKKVELLGQNNAREHIAKAADVSESTVRKYMKIWGSGATTLVERVRNGEEKIGAAYKKLFVNTKVVEVLCKTDPMYLKAVGYLDKLWRLYDLLCEAVGNVPDAEDVQSIKEMLEEQKNFDQILP